MVYKRRRFFPKRRTYRKRRYFPRYSRKRLPTPETKLVEIALSGTFSSISNSWTELELTNIAQGIADYQRIGDHITSRYFSLQGTLVGGQSNLATDDNRNVVRIVLAWWDGRSTTPCASNSVVINDRIALDDTTGIGLMKILYDRTLTLNSPGRDSTGYMPAQRFVKFSRRLLRRVPYTGSNGQTGNRKLILSIISDSLVASNPGFVMGRAIFKFMDN